MFTDEQLRSVLPDDITLGEQIQGGKRIVYAAEQGDKKIVIKLMAKDQLERAERDVSIGSTFDHPNLAPILDTDVRRDKIDGEEYVWFREEFVPGEALSKDRTNTTPARR